MTGVVSPQAPSPPSKAAVSWLLTSLFVLATVMIYLIPPSSQILFPAFAQVRETGFYPDGLPVRRRYTGVYVLDEMCTGLAGLFSAASDGRDFATHLFCVWFLPQLCAVLTFIYWEAGKVDASGQFRFARWPTFFGVLAQLIAAGPTLPLYFIAHIRGIPLVPTTLPHDAWARARTLLPAITIGFCVPSAALFLVLSTSMSLDTKQIIAAIWQPFPLYIAVLFPTLAYITYNISTHPKTAKDARQSAQAWIKLSYVVSGVLSSVAHWAIFFPAAFPVIPTFVEGLDDPAVSFRHIFIPYILHPYLPDTHTQPPPPLAGYRLAARLLFQHDWLYMTFAAFVFFAWHHASILQSYSGSGNVNSILEFRRWLGMITLLTLIGGPGAAFSWAAVQREHVLGDILAIRSVRLERKQTKRWKSHNLMAITRS